MPKLPAYDGVTLALGNTVVRLRPSLRAAFQLPAPPDLTHDVAGLNLGTIHEIITTAATDQKEAAAFLAQIDTTPLQTVADTIIAPLFQFLASFTPPDNGDDKPAPSSKPMAWPDVVRLLYRRATGFLRWTPETTWHATPAEISEAFAGWMEYIEATTPRRADETEDKPKAPDTYTDERLQQIDEQGFDPAFDRAGLRALKRRIASGQ